MKTLCFGSLNIDNVYTVPHFVVRGETLAADQLNIFSGGKGLNQCIALSRAGLEVYHAGAIGSDGAFLLRELQEAGVDTRFVRVLPDVRTGHAIIQKDEDGDNCILLNGGANRKITREQIDETLSHFSRGDLLVLQNEISELAYLIGQAKKAGLLTVLNPSPMDKTLLPLIAQVGAIILNEHEAAQFLQTETPDEPEKMARELIRRYPELTVILTTGKDGSFYAKGPELIRQKAFSVRAVDTTGAGDTFTGYFFAGLMNGMAPEKAMEYASAASAIAVTRMGAAPSIPVKEEVIRFLEEN